MPGPGYWSSKNYFGAAPTFAVGATFGGNLDMGNNLVINIGAAGTDFTSGGGLALAGALTVTSTTNTVDIGTATALFRTAYFGTSVQSGVSAALDADIIGGTPRFAVVSSNAATHLVSVATGANTAGIADLGFKTRSSGTDANAIVVSGDGIRTWDSYGADGASYILTARIISEVTGTVASTRVPSQIRFMTSTDATPSVLTTALTLGADQRAVFTSSVEAGSGQFFRFTGSSIFLDSGNGILTLQNAAQTDFTRLNFGGTTSSFPAIGRNGTVLEFRLADGTAGGSVALTGKASTYNNITTTGWGVPAIYGTGRSTAQTAAVASVATYTVGAADGSFLVSANVLVTTSTTHNFTATVAYTDEGNTARTLTLSFSQLTGTFLTAITNVTGAGPYEGIPVHIRCKAATAITIATTGTFTTVTYNVEGSIVQMS